ncbi:MAG: toprim domain-containing protein [Roseivirga sp.]
MASSHSRSITTENPYERIKKEINLPHFATTRLGWERDPEKSTAKTLVLRHPHYGKILVYTSPSRSSGHWHFYKPGAIVMRQGTLIDLLLKHQWSWEAIRALGSNYVATAEETPLTGPSSAMIQAPLEQSALAQEQLQKLASTADTTTYLSTRGLEARTYASFPQLKTNRYQAIFSLFKDFKEHPGGRLCSTIAYYFSEGKSKKYFHKGLPRGLSVLTDTSAPERILLTESPIDALSFRELEAASPPPKVVPTTMYVATCGTLSSSMQSDLEALFQRATRDAQTVVLAFDSDEAGVKMTEQAIDLLKGQGTAYEVIPVSGEHKDWNEVLQAERAVAASQAAQQRLEAFEQTAPEQSLLKDLGIAPSASKELVTALKANSKAVVWGLYKDVASPSRSLVSTYTLQQNEQGALRDYFQKGLPRGLSLLEGGHPPERIVVTESPIEALQRRQALYEALQKEEALLARAAQPGGKEFPAREQPAPLVAARQAFERTLFVSTCGPLTQGLRKELDQLFLLAQEKQWPITLALDQEALALCEKSLHEHSYPFTREPHAPFWQGTEQRTQPLQALSSSPHTEALHASLALKKSF